MNKITIFIDSQNNEMSIENRNDTVVLILNDHEFYLQDKEDWIQFCREVNSIFSQIEEDLKLKK